MKVLRIAHFIWKRFSSYWPYLAVLFVVGLISSFLGGLGIGMVIPLLSFLSGSPDGPTDAISQYILRALSFFSIEPTLTSLLVVLTSLFFVRALLLILFNFVRAHLVYRYKVDILDVLFRGLYHWRWEHLVRMKAGNLQNLFLRDVDKSSDLLRAIPDFFFFVSNVLIFLWFAFIISPLLTFFTAVGGVIAIFVFQPMTRGLRAKVGELAGKNRKVTQFIIEQAIGMKAMKTSGDPKEVTEGAHTLFDEWRNVERIVSTYTNIYKHSIEPMIVVFIAGVLWMSYDTPGFSIEAFAAIIFLIQRIFLQIRGSQIVMSGFAESIPYLYDVARREKEFRDGQENVHPGDEFPVEKTVLFEDVSLSYSRKRTEEKRPAVSHVSFRIREGEVVALVGPSGSGKTSLVDMLLRLFEPTSGRIMIGGKDIRTLDLFSFRTNVGYVPQDSFLLNTSIEENIRFFNREITDERVFEAARQANIYDFVMTLPQGFKTSVGDRGVMLSGGQRQRIALARVLARRPTILILDEATSALDSESEVKIQEAIQALHGKVTIFIIAHQFSMVRNAERVIVLEDGRIVEEGSPHELLERSESRFSGMYNKN